MTMIEEQIKLGLYDKYHDLDVINNNNQSINCCWFAEDNILKIGIDAYNKKNNYSQSIRFQVEIKSIEQINKIVSKFEDFIKELK
jgi:type IV secretory pathway component VirB8